jgi:putative glycosyltransferase (TIGR04372 family)
MTIKQRLKSGLKNSLFWHVFKYILPKYHRPLARLSLAQASVILRPGPASARRLAFAHVEMAKLRIYEQDTKRALAQCDEALAIDPACADAFLIRGHALIHAGKLKDATKDYRKALALRPDDADLHMSLGYALKCDFEDDAIADEIVDRFETAIRLAPDRLDYYPKAASIYSDIGRLENLELMWSRRIALQNKQARRRGLDKLEMRILGDSWLSAMGHIALLDYYLKMSALGWLPRKIVLILRPDLHVPNRALLDYWRPYIDIVTDPSALNLSWDDVKLLEDEQWAATFPDGKTRWYLPAGITVQRQWAAEKRPPLVSLSAADRERGNACLKELGIPEDAWFVALHVREPGFWKQFDDKHPAIRDANIDTYLDAIRSITSRGGWVIRLGDPKMKPLPPMEHVIDYAHSPLKSEWLDVFLCAACRFFVGTMSGPFQIPSMFGRPCALTNWAALGFAPWHDDVWIPKLYRRRGEQRLLRFDEAYSLGFRFKAHKGRFDNRGVDVVDNTAEEINALVLEMLDRVDGIIKYEPEDERLQKRFEQITTANGGYTAARVGRDFLRRHNDLIAAAPQPVPAA